VIDAARALLASPHGYTAFTVDAVAKRADVARATLYYQFGTKTGLIEALCDALATAGGLEHLPAAFTSSDPHDGLVTLIERFATFWSTDRVVMRRLRALGVLDPDVGSVIATRDARLRAALGRLPGALGAAAVVHALIGFETFDAIAGADRQPTDIVPTVLGLVEAVLNLEVNR